MKKYSHQTNPSANERFTQHDSGAKMYQLRQFQSCSRENNRICPFGSNRKRFSYSIELDNPHTICKVQTSDADAGTELLRSRLRCLFFATPGNLPDMGSAGLVLGMSVRTMHRKLAASGQSYQALKDEFRLDLAREYLRSGNMMRKQVAYSLGFKRSGDFHRAFKAWTGQTVRQFLMSDEE